MEDEWIFASTTAACFLSHAIEPTDADTGRTFVTFGEFELVSVDRGSPPNEAFVRVTTTVEAVAGATKVSLQVKDGPSIRLKPHRPGGNALRYVEFNGSSHEAQAVVHALMTGNSIEVVFHVGLLKKIRGVVTPDGLPSEIAKFNACVESLGNGLQSHSPSEGTHNGDADADRR